MTDKNDTTIRIDQNESSAVGIGDTVRIEVTSDTVRIDNTQRVEQSTVISSGLGGGIKLNTVTPNEYQLNGTKYTLLEKISESTAEAQIFLISNGKKKFVLKYYYPFVKPKMEVIEKLRTFSHPDIVQVIDSGYFEERFFEITSYADQGSLLKHIPVNDVKLIKRFVKEIVNALEHCHKNGIIHRDIKPANIFVKDKKKKDIIVGDFGIASIVGSDEDLRRTSIFQTPIYAAPEYRMTLGGQTIISKAVDYYALGITVWEMWSGKLPPDDMDDLDFLRLMFEGTPPLPAGMDDEVACLIEGLTTRDYKKRWGYDEVQKWLNGKPVDVYRETKQSSTQQFYFGEDDKGKKLTANSAKDLAKLIFLYQDLGRKHLYRGTIKEWLKKAGDQRLFLEIADLTDYRFKDDEVTGTKYSVYILDRNFPFFGVDSDQCRTKEEIVNELRNHFDKYKSALKNPNHSLFLYLLSKNMEKEVEQFRNYFNTLNGEAALYYLIYSLTFTFNPNCKYLFKSSGKKLQVADANEAAELVYKNPKLADEIKQSNEFYVWLEFKNKEILDDVKKFINESSDSKKFNRLLPYVLNPNKGYTGITGEECFTLKDIGNEIADNYKQYINLLKNPDCRLYDYLEKYGYTGEVEFYQQVFDMEKASSKSALYNDNIAVCKIIKSTGRSMLITVQGIELRKPEDIADNYSKFSNDFKNDLSDPNSFISAWLYVFFHEEPMSDDGEFYIYWREDYEARLNRLMDFLKKLDGSNKLVERHNKAQKKISSAERKGSIPVTRRNIEWVIAFILPIIFSLALLAYSIFVDDTNLPGSAFSLNSWYFIVFALLTAGWLLKDGYSSGEFSLSTGCVGGPIIGVILAVIIYYLFYFVIEVPIVLGLVLAGAIYFFYLILAQVKDDNYDLFQKPSIELTEQEKYDLIFNYTFGKTKSVDISELHEDEKEGKLVYHLSLWGLSLGFCTIITLIIILLLSYEPIFSL